MVRSNSACFVLSTHSRNCQFKLRMEITSGKLSMFAMLIEHASRSAEVSSGGTIGRFVLNLPG